jgi:3-oxoadipate enol-lactonase
LKLLDFLGIARAHFCGLSMGGMTGMWLGIHAAERLASLTLANTAARIGPVAMWNERIAIVMTAGMSAISDAAVARWFTPSFVAEEPEVVAKVKGSMERTLPDGYAQCCAAVRDADFSEDVARIATPVLVINGAHDLATPPAEGHFLAQRIPGAHSVTLNAAHLSNIEAPLEFSDALRSFCRVDQVSVRESQG